MNLKPNIVITATLLGLVLWSLIDYQYRRRINYEWHEFLINATNGQPIKPNELLDIRRVTRFEDDYLNSTSAVDRANDLAFQSNLVHTLELDQRYFDEKALAVSGWPVADQAKCAQQLTWIRDRLHENKNYALAKGRLAHELTRLMDTFGKPPSAFYSGLTSWTGSYERCLTTTLDHGQIKTRYCWARLKFKSWPRVQPVRPQPRIRVGVCLPETCDTTSFDQQRHQIEWLLKLELNEFYRENLELDSMFCLPDERSPIRQISTGGRIYIGLASCWIAVILIGTIIYEIDRKRQRKEYGEESKGSHQDQPLRLISTTQKFSLERKPDSPVSRLVHALSIHNSIKEFMKYNQAHIDKFSRVDLRCLDMVKSVMTIMIVIAHGLYMSVRFARIILGQYELATSGTALAVMSAGRFVESFFLLFGLLATYTLMRKFEVDQLIRPSTWLTYNIGVMVRLMPVYLPLYFYSKLISTHTGDGPWWDYGLNTWSLKGLCLRESTWKIIPHIASYGVFPGTACVAPAWFIVVYCQLCLPIPLFIYTVSKITSNFGRTLMVLSVCLLSSLALSLRLINQTTFDDDSFGSYGALMVELLQKFESFGYMSATARAGTVAIGCYTGYLLRTYELVESYKWPKVFRSRLTLSLVIFFNVMIYSLPYIGGLISRLTDRKSTLLEFVLGNILSSLAWSISNAALIMLATTTYRRTAVVRFAGHAIWHSINKLGLAVYLVHWEILWLAVTGNEQAPSMGFLANFWNLSAFGLVAAFPVAFAIYILFEAPVISLMSAYQRRFVKRETTLELEIKPGKTTDTNSIHLTTS